MDKITMTLRGERVRPMRWLPRLLVASAIWMPVVGLAALLLVSARHHRAVERAFAPILWLCEVATPDDWQARGNALLGVGWFWLGVVAYAVACGGATVIVLSMWRVWAARKQVEAGGS